MKEISDQVKRQVLDQVSGQWDQVNQVMYEVKDQAFDQIWEQVRDHVRNNGDLIKGNTQ